MRVTTAGDAAVPTFAPSPTIQITAVTKRYPALRTAGQRSLAALTGLWSARYPRWLASCVDRYRVFVLFVPRVIARKHGVSRPPQVAEC